MVEATEKTLALNNQSVEKGLDNLKNMLQETSESMPDTLANDGIPTNVLLEIITLVQQAELVFSKYTKPLTTAERRRLIGYGIKSEGFVNSAYNAALLNTQFLPQYLTLSQYSNDKKDYDRKTQLLLLLKQFEKEVSDATLSASDRVYKDGLDYYNVVKEAVKRKIIGALPVYDLLKKYFYKHRTATTEPTEAKIKRDLRSLLRGTKDGKIIIKNSMPTIKKGEQEVIDNVQ